MASVNVHKNEKVIIVGAGVFGLSTAIHLAERGYSEVTVFDKNDYDVTQYSYFRGADAASADLNKIVRSAYGGVSIYQNLTLEAIEGWDRWNDELANGTVQPPGLKRTDKIFIPNGNLIMTDAADLPDFDRATVDSMEAAGHHHSQLITANPEHRDIARSKGFGFAIDPFQREQRRQSNVAVIDTTGGTAVADKACRFALEKARKLGVRFVFGSQTGAISGFLHSSASPSHVEGIVTADGKQWRSDLTIVACGGWTPALLPQLDGLCEATAGSVAFIKIPRHSKLWHRFAPENFPSWQWKMRDGAEAGLYGFARDDNGWLKVGYRGSKYTNPIVQADGKERSVPITRWSSDGPGGERLDAIPRQALKVIQKFLAEHLPELAEEGLAISMTRVCWYTDSFDNHLLIDRVPGTEGLMVATAGSGHAFKYLPTIGKYVVDVIEGVGQNRDCFDAWRWRSVQAGSTPVNILMEGSKGNQVLRQNALVWDRALARL